MLCKGLTAPALPALPGRELIAGKGSDGTNGKNSTPLQGLIFSKSRVHGYGQNLGKGGLAHRKPEPDLN